MKWDGVNYLKKLNLIHIQQVSSVLYKEHIYLVMVAQISQQKWLLKLPVW